MREKLIELLETVPPLDAVIMGLRNGKQLISTSRVADHLIANGVTVQQWIPVSERLPFAEYGESKDVLAVTELGVIRVLFFDGGNWCFQNGECCTHKITHWMPLPEQPKGD